MIGLLGSLALAICQGALPSSDDPRVVVRMATRAVEGDTAGRVDARFAARIDREPRDRAALLGLATLARLRYDYPAAESTYRRLIASHTDRYAVYAHLGLAEGFEARSFGRDARAEFDRALSAARTVGDRTAEGEATLWLAFSRGRLEGVAVAEELLAAATRLLPDTALDLQSRLRNRRAIVHALRGRPTDAVAEAESAIVLARRARDPRAEGDGYRVLGQVLQYRGQWDSALTALHRSEGLYRQARNRTALANSLIWHAQVLGTVGRYGDMREVMRRALAEGEATHNPAAVGDAHRAFGVLAAMLGDWPGAATHFKQSTAISAASGDSSGVMTTGKYLVSVSLAAGDLATARRITLEHLALARRTEDALDRFDAHRVLADIAERERDWATAARNLDSARAQLRLLPGANYRIWLTHDEARLALARGDLPSAERFLLAYLESQTGKGIGQTRFDARVRLAEVFARGGRLERAEREMLTATEEVDQWRAQLGDRELRTMAFQAAATINAATAGPAAIAASAARVVAALAAAGRVETAFTLAERWRARDLVDRLARAASLRSGASPPSTGARTTAAPRSSREIVAALPDNGIALLEFVAAKGAPITLFVVQRRGVEARVLPPVDSLAGSVARFAALVESGADASRLGRSLGAALLDRAVPLLDTSVTRLVVVPDGPLHRVPFDALRLADGRYVLQRYAVGLAPSASAAAALWARRVTPERSAPVRLLAVGDPATQMTTRGSWRDAASADFAAAAESAGGLPRLRGAAREARLVAAYAPAADVRLGADASAAFLKRADLRRYRVLHFASHAVVDERSVAGTALALAPGNGESGFVGAGDLAALRLDADLVVLSACRTAGGVVVAGEGVQGLTSPLLAAGARALVATHWRIRDQDAVPFIDAMYAALSRGQPVIDALRAAKLRALARGEPPRTWASFLSIGDPLVVVPLRTPAVHRRWLAAIRGAWR